MNMELFKALARRRPGPRALQRASTQARTDLLSGQVQLVVDGLLPNLPHIRAGKLKALRRDQRAPRARPRPRSRRWSEAGVPGYVSDTWYAPARPGRHARRQCSSSCASATGSRAEEPGAAREIRPAGRGAGRRRPGGARRADAHRPRALAQGRRRRASCRWTEREARPHRRSDRGRRRGAARAQRRGRALARQRPATIRAPGARRRRHHHPQQAARRHLPAPRRACARWRSTAPAPTSCRSPTRPRAACMVSNIPGGNAQSVAEYCVMAMLMLARQHVRDHRFAEERLPGTTRARSAPARTRSPRMTVGIVGVGEIGTRVAQHLPPRLRHARARPPAAPGPAARRTPSLRRWTTWSPARDFVVVTCPLTPETHHLFNEKRIGAMKPTAWLINVGRGAGGARKPR